MQNKKHNCKIHGTTAKQIAQLPKKMNYGNFPLPSIPVVPLCQFFGCGGKYLLNYHEGKGKYSTTAKRIPT